MGGDNDKLHGLSGNDTLNGGAGSDYYYYYLSAADSPWEGVGYDNVYINAGDEIHFPMVQGGTGIGFATSVSTFDKVLLTTEFQGYSYIAGNHILVVYVGNEAFVTVDINRNNLVCNGWIIYKTSW